MDDHQPQLSYLYRVVREIIETVGPISPELEASLKTTIFQHIEEDEKVEQIRRGGERVL